MSLLNRIRSESLQARKSGDRVRASLLVTLLSEAQAIGKNDGDRETTDAEVIAVVKKFIKNAEQTSRDALASIQTNKMDVIQRSADEVKILTEYLPKQLTEEDIVSIIKNLRTSEEIVDMKFIMSYFKNVFPGQYDGALVAKWAK